MSNDPPETRALGGYDPAPAGKAITALKTLGAAFLLVIAGTLMFSEINLPAPGEQGSGSAIQTEWLVPISGGDHMPALGGYDPVSYFSPNGPELGNAGISTQWQGTTWHFASDANREAFASNPGLYAPQFGGHCAFAASLGKRVAGDPEVWTVVDGRLILNANPVARILTRAVPGRLAAAYGNWPEVSAQPLE